MPVLMSCLCLSLAVVTLCGTASATVLVAGSTAAAAAATGVTVGISSSTAAAAAVTAAGVGTAAVVGALAASGVIRNSRRHKRDASSQQCFGLDNPELMYILAANSDQLGCGQRLVCELEATPDAELNETERQILDLFGRDVRPLKASQMLNPKSAYHYAAQIGSKASSPGECAEVFDLCPLDRPSIMATYAQFAGATNLE